jgi:hypothetical protein
LCAAVGSMNAKGEGWDQRLQPALCQKRAVSKCSKQRPIRSPRRRWQAATTER